MPRIRTIKPEAPQHYKVGRLSDAAFRLWIVMLTQADDEGRFVADPGQLRFLTWGYHDDMTVSKTQTVLQEIAETGLIVRYDVRNVPYAWFPSWRDHQKIDRPTPSKLPPPPQLRSTRTRRAVAEDSPKPRRGLAADRIGSDRKGSDRIGRERTGDGNPDPIAHASSNQGNGHRDNPGDAPLPADILGVIARLKAKQAEIQPDPIGQTQELAP